MMEHSVEALRCKTKVYGFDYQWSSLGFFIDLILPAAL